MNNKRPYLSQSKSFKEFVELAGQEKIIKASKWVKLKKNGKPVIFKGHMVLRQIPYGCKTFGIEQEDVPNWILDYMKENNVNFAIAYVGDSSICKEYHKLVVKR